MRGFRRTAAFERVGVDERDAEVAHPGRAALAEPDLEAHAVDHAGRRRVVLGRAAGRAGWRRGPLDRDLRSRGTTRTGRRAIETESP